MIFDELPGLLLRDLSRLTVWMAWLPVLAALVLVFQRRHPALAIHGIFIAGYMACFAWMLKYADAFSSDPGIVPLSFYFALPRQSASHFVPLVVLAPIVLFQGRDGLPAVGWRPWIGLLTTWTNAFLSIYGWSFYFFSWHQSPPDWTVLYAFLTG